MDKEKLWVIPEDGEEYQPLLGGTESVQDGGRELDVGLPPGKTSPFGAVFIIVNASLGAGLLAFPVAFQWAGGVLQALLAMSFSLVWITLSLLILAHLAETLQASTYEEVVGKACGSLVRAVVEVCIVTYSFGANIAFLVVIGDQLQDLFAAVHDAGEWWMDRRLLVSVAALLFILPWLWMQRIGVLSYTSFLGVVCCGYISLVVSVRYFVPYQDQSPSNMTCRHTTPLQECEVQWPDFFTSLPFICFGYQCHVSSVPVYVGLKRRSLQAYLPLVAVALAICLLVYSLTGVFGFLSYNKYLCISSDILQNYCPRDPPVDVARVMLILVMITSYPILAFCARTALDCRVRQVMHRLAPLRLLALEKWRWWERVRLGSEGTLWLLLSLLLAFFVPQISSVINPIGGLAALLMFFFPAMSLLHLSLDRHRNLQKWLKFAVIVICSFLLVLGSFVFGTSVVYNIMLDFGVL